MIVETLALQNFMRYRKRCSLDFRNKRTIGIVGENESGKSTILQAISYGIYGKTRAERELQLINDEADGDLLVELALRFPDDSRLEITRGRTAKNESILQLAGMGKAKPTDVAEAILEAVRLSYDDFIALTYFLQGDLHQFMTGNKRAYFQRWTAGLRLWQQYETTASRRLLDIDEDINKADHERERQQEILDGAKEIKAEARAAKIALQQSKDEVDIVQDQVDTLQASYQEMAESGSEVKESVRQLTNELQALQSDHYRITRELQAAESAVKRLGSGRCPVLSIECSTLKESGAEEKKEARRTAANLAAQEREALKEVHEAKKRLDAATKEAQSSYLAGLNDVGAQLKQAQAELRDANIALRRATGRYEKAAAAFERLKDAKRRMIAAGKIRATRETERRRMQFVRYMCGKAGIPALLIESELERVEDRCNWVLERLDYPKRIRFSGYRELAGFEKVCPACGSERWHNQECKGCGTPRPRQRREEPTVTVLDGTTERPFALESGGAQVLQSFAVRLAASLFVSSLSGVPMRMVMLDEVFGMLDANNRQKLMALVIDKLSTEFGLQQQFVVSHQEDVVNAVDDLLVIRSERGGAVARWQ